MDSLPIFLRLADRPVILLGEGEAAAAKRRLVERAGGRIVDEGTVAAIAIVAIEDDAMAAAAVARLRARGILVNAVDRPALCDFTLPAIVDRDPVLVAIGTGGASAGLAKALRQRLEAMLPTGLGELARGMYAARAGIRARWPDAADRRRAIDAALAEAGALDPLKPVEAGAIDTWLDAPEDAPPIDDRRIRIRLRSADPDDLTLGEARWIGMADRILHRGDVPQAILARARADAERVAWDERAGATRPGLTIELEMAS